LYLSIICEASIAVMDDTCGANIYRPSAKRPQTLVEHAHTTQKASPASIVKHPYVACARIRRLDTDRIKSLRDTLRQLRSHHFIDRTFFEPVRHGAEQMLIMPSHPPVTRNCTRHHVCRSREPSRFRNQWVRIKKACNECRPIWHLYQLDGDIA
jgi:hypothetical protein